MQEWEDPLRFNLDLRLLQRQGHNQPTDRPTDRPSALTPKKKKKKKKKKKSYCLDIRSTHALLCSFSFFEWGFVVKFVSLFFILDWSVIPWRKLSRRLADAKIKPPRCWDPNRWLFRDFPTFTVCFLSSSDASRILCSLPCNSVTTARIRACFSLDLLHLSTFSLFFFFLFLLPSFAGNASACVCVCVCVCVTRNSKAVFNRFFAPTIELSVRPRDFSRPVWPYSYGYCNRSGVTGAPLRGRTARDVHHAGRHKNRRSSPAIGTGHAGSHARWVLFCYSINQQITAELCARVRQQTRLPVWMPLLRMHARCCFFFLFFCILFFFLFFFLMRTGSPKKEGKKTRKSSHLSVDRLREKWCWNERFLFWCDCEENPPWA